MYRNVSKCIELGRTGGLHLSPQLLATYESIQALELAPEVVYRGVFVHDIDQWEVVFLP